MKSHPRTPESQEVELKLSLPGANPTELAKRLGSLPLLAGGKATRQSLHNIYFDTADQHLRRQRAALRLRRIGSAVHPQWVQTLKTSAADESALSRRGEWETAVPSAQLSLQALQSTPWTEMDSDTRLFDSLEPCFVTDFQRTSWLLTRPDGSVVELALDIGHIEANGRQASICEIELELKSGQVGALFEVAQRIAITVAVLPANQSKAERGFLLAQDGLDQPKGANPPPIGQHLSQTGLAQQVLREMFAQFTHNLNALRSNDDPELVHQARVGWRRFRSAMRLFKKLPQMANAPIWPELAALLSFLGELRNLEVALLETLPPLANGYCRGDEQRTQSWQEMLTCAWGFVWLGWGRWLLGVGGCWGLGGGSGVVVGRPCGGGAAGPWSGLSGSGGRGGCWVPSRGGWCLGGSPGRVGVSVLGVSRPWGGFFCDDLVGGVRVGHWWAPGRVCLVGRVALGVGVPGLGQWYRGTGIGRPSRDLGLGARPSGPGAVWGGRLARGARGGDRARPSAEGCGVWV